MQGDRIQYLLNLQRNKACHIFNRGVRPSKTVLYNCAVVITNNYPEIESRTYFQLIFSDFLRTFYIDASEKKRNENMHFN